MAKGDFVDLAYIERESAKAVNNRLKDWKKEYVKVLPVDDSPKRDSYVLRKDISTKVQSSSFPIMSYSLDVYKVKPYSGQFDSYYERINYDNKKNPQYLGYLEKCEPIGVDTVIDPFIDIDFDQILERA